MKILRLFLVIFVFFAAETIALENDIFKAAEKGDIEMVKALVKKNPQLVKAKNKRENTALHIASNKGHLNIVEYLLQNGADINAKNKFQLTPLFYAAETGNVELAQMLMKHKADVNAISQFFGSALHRAVYRNFPEVAKYLLKRGANVTVQNSTGTVLHTAAMMGRLNLARLLVKNGADVNSKNSKGITPLYYAISTGNDRSSELAMYFINSGADVNAKDNEGRSVLMMAVWQGFPEVVEQLIMKGADKAVRDDITKQNLLHFTAINGYGDVARILIKNGLDVNVRDGSGKTPLYYAGMYGNQTVAEPLVKAGAGKVKGESNFGDSKYLKKKMGRIEAYIWLLKNRGYVIKTRDHLFIFDNEETGRKPDTPSVDNGHYSLSELKDLKVLALYSAYHARSNTMEFIHALEDSIDNITYLHYKDDRWRGGKKSRYLKGRETHRIYGADIHAMEAHEAYGMGSLGYLVKVDGLTFFYSSFPTTKIEEFKKGIDFIAEKVKSCDLVFVMAMPGEGEACADYIVEKLKPRAVLPMGHKSLHKHFESFMKKLAQKYPGIKIASPHYGGDRVHYKNGEFVE